MRDEGRRTNVQNAIPALFLRPKNTIKREDDGRWLAEAIDLPGVMASGASREEATARAKALALRVIAGRLERGEDVPDLTPLFAEAA